MKTTRRLFIHIFLLLFVATAGAVTPPKRVLFIGNSYTHFNDLPAIVREIAKANGAELQTTAHTPGGATFQKHWEGGKALEWIRKGGWDAVVLQNQSYEPVSDPQNMQLYAEKLAAEIRKASPQARIILFNTWAYGGTKATPDMQKLLDAAYAARAKKINAEIAPVGQAWALALQADPKLRLHSGDNSHPTAEGSYLAAAAIHARLFGAVPPSLPAEIGTAEKTRPAKIQLTDLQRTAFAKHITVALAAAK